MNKFWNILGLLFLHIHDQDEHKSQLMCFLVFNFVLLFFLWLKLIIFFFKNLEAYTELA